jgi:enoyl-CoA hydratase/carnithine racemase
LIDELAAPDGVLYSALAHAERWGRRPKLAIAAGKRAVYEGGSLPLSGGLRLERAEFLAALGTREAKEAMQAYLDAFDETGRLPAYDPESFQKALESGRFGA